VKTVKTSIATLNTDFRFGGHCEEGVGAGREAHFKSSLFWTFFELSESTAKPLLFWRESYGLAWLYVHTYIRPNWTLNIERKFSLKVEKSCRSYYFNVQRPCSCVYAANRYVRTGIGSYVLDMKNTALRSRKTWANPTTLQLQTGPALYVCT
jgi:hypothetical protein